MVFQSSEAGTETEMLRNFVRGTHDELVNSSLVARATREQRVVAAMLLRIGYFENFKGADTILVCGDEEGLQQLADHLRLLEDRRTEPVMLHLLPFIRASHRIEMTAYPVDRELGVRRTGSGVMFRMAPLRGGLA